MGIVCGLIIFVAFYVDMIWMNCIYPEMAKNKKEPKEIEANSKRSSLICMIVLAIMVAISYFAKLSQIVLFAASASLFMCVLKYLSFFKFFKKEKTDYLRDDYENSFYDEEYLPGNIFDDIDSDDGDEETAFEEYDFEDNEDAFRELFQKYNGEDAETSVEASEENVDEDIIDVIDGKTYI